MKQNIFDAIVIGSGMGALSVASILAQMNDKRVLVIERHFEIGGFTHSFRRKGYSWDVGLHYVGDMHEGSMLKSIMDYVTGGRLKWEKMPENFERFIYPGLVFDVPADPVEYRSRLTAAFPHEQKAIEKYFKDIDAATGLYRQVFMGRLLPAADLPDHESGKPDGAGTLLQMTTEDYLRANISDEKLRVLLTSQWGDYGVPAARSSFAIHALIVSHYLKGAYYPHGGAERIARIVEEIVESRGGAFLTNSEAIGIITQNGGAEGVRVRHMPQDETAEYFSKTIISDAGAVATYKRLLAGSEDRRIGKYVRELTPLDSGMSAVILFLGFHSSPEGLGIRGENWWINETTEPLDEKAQSDRLLRGAPAAAYLSFPSIKAGDGRPSTAEIIALVDPACFAPWRGQPWRRRDPAYYALKDKITGGLLALVERHIPGFGALVAYQELATPLTIEHFSGREEGRMYGVVDVPEKFNTSALQAETPIRGLYLTGSDVCSLGIGGALMGGVGTASVLNGPSGFSLIMNAAMSASRRERTGGVSEETPGPGPGMTGALEPLPNQKLSALLVEKTPVTDTVYELVFELPCDVKFEPGQYARVFVGDYEWRDYSIVELCGRRVTFLIDTRFNGMGSRYVRSLSPGAATFMRLPVGDFTIAAKEHAHCFIATGTGITPFIPMIKLLQSRGNPVSAELFFGCRFERDSSIIERLERETEACRVGITVCVSREKPSERAFHGRVTDLLRARTFDAENTDFYVCGNPSMVGDTVEILHQKGMKNIYREQY